MKVKFLLPFLFLFAFTASAHTITAQGNAQIDTAQSKFGGASGLFDGTGDYLSTPDSTDWNLSADFTISFWVRFNSLASGYASFAATNDGGSVNGWQFYYQDSDKTLQIWTGNGTGRSVTWNAGGTSPTLNQWYHVALIRSGTTVTLYVDGSSRGTVADGDFNNDGIALGIASAAGNSAVVPLDGWLDDFSIQKGTARWTSNFTPPTSADCLLTNGVLLLHMDGTNGSTTFTDDNATACPPTSTCTYSGTGNWNVKYSDACYITSPVYVNGAFHLIYDGAGSFGTTKDISAQGIFQDPSANIQLLSGASLSTRP